MKRNYKASLELSSPRRVSSKPNLLVLQSTKHQTRPKPTPKHFLKPDLRTDPSQTSIKASPEAKATPNNVRHKRHFSDMNQSKHTSYASYASLKHSIKTPSRKKIKSGTVHDYPITPANAIKHFHQDLSNFEQGEILNYKQVYFVGKKANKVVPNTNSELNYGYDDERGDYNIMIGDHIGYRFEILKLLGSGSFGRVVKVLDHKTHTELALKIIKNRPRFHQQAVVEIKILKLLQEKDIEGSFNVVKIYDYFAFRNHICLTFELLGLTLYDFLKKSDFQGLSLKLIRRLSVQILHTLKAQANFNIIHCDLKPENIMFKNLNQSTIRVIDFGSSCFEKEKIYTYIQSRFYRAPEIIMGIPYTPKIDMWSFGCILVELYTGRPLFPGECEAEQILCIMELLNLPPQSVLAHATRSKMFFDGETPLPYTNRRGRTRIPCTKSLNSVLLGADALFIDLVRQCLEWEPAKRISAKDAMGHPWITQRENPKHHRNNSWQPNQKTTKIRHTHKPSLEEELNEAILNQSYLPRKSYKHL